MMAFTEQKGAQLNQTLQLVCQQCGIQAPEIMWDPILTEYITTSGEVVNTFIERVRQWKSDRDEELRNVR